MYKEVHSNDGYHSLVLSGNGARSIGLVRVSVSDFSGDRGVVTLGYSSPPEHPLLLFRGGNGDQCYCQFVVSHFGVGA